MFTCILRLKGLQCGPGRVPRWRSLLDRCFTIQLLVRRISVASIAKGAGHWLWRRRTDWWALLPLAVGKKMNTNNGCWLYSYNCAGGQQFRLLWLWIQYDLLTTLSISTSSIIAPTGPGRFILMCVCEVYGCCPPDGRIRRCLGGGCWAARNITTRSWHGERNMRPLFSFFLWLHCYFHTRVVWLYEIALAT